MFLGPHLGAMHPALLRPIVALHSIALLRPIFMLQGIAALQNLGTTRHERITSEQHHTRLLPPTGFFVTSKPPRCMGGS